MTEAFMLILLGVFLTALIALGLSPVLWNRAVKVTTERLHDDVRGKTSAEVSRRYEDKLAAREEALRQEIAELEASRDKISAEASGRVGELEESRSSLETRIRTLEEEAAALKGKLKERDELIAAAERELVQAHNTAEGFRNKLSGLTAQFKDLGGRAEALAREAADLGAAHDRIATGLHNGNGHAPTPPATPEPTAHVVEEPANDPAPAAEAVTSTAATLTPPAPEPAAMPPIMEANGEADEEVMELAEEALEADDDVPETQPSQRSLAERIRALRENAPA